MCTWLYIFSAQLSLCFYPETERKCTLKRFQNPYRGAAKLLIHWKIIFQTKDFAKNDLHKHSSEMTTTTTTTTLTSFPYYRLKKFKKLFLKLPYNTHGKRFIVYLWVMVALMGGVLGGLLSSQRLDEYFIEVISVLNGNIQQARAIGHFRVA